MAVVILVAPLANAVLWTALALFVTKDSLTEVWPIAVLALVLSVFSSIVGWFFFLARYWYSL